MKPDRMALVLFDQLDGISRQRALNDHESVMLERAQRALVSSPHLYPRRELIRRGIVKG